MSCNTMRYNVMRYHEISMSVHRHPPPLPPSPTILPLPSPSPPPTTHLLVLIKGIHHHPLLTLRSNVEHHLSAPLTADLHSRNMCRHVFSKQIATPIKREDLSVRNVTLDQGVPAGKPPFYLSAGGKSCNPVVLHHSPAPPTSHLPHPLPSPIYSPSASSTEVIREV